MKYLITGSSGLIGSQLIFDLEQSRNIIYSCYNNLKPQHGIPIKLDLLNFKEISTTIQKFRPDIIIHLAALTDVEKCELEPKLAHSINTQATEIIAKEANHLDCFLVYLSTDYVFDGNKGMYDEYDIPNPINEYGKTKLFGEKSVENNASNWSIIRTSTPFGLHSQKKTFPVWVVDNILKNKKLDIVKDQLTSPTYIPNLSKMILEITSQNLEGYYHLSGSTRISRFDFAKKIVDKLDLNSSMLNPVTLDSMLWKSKRPVDSSLNISKANSSLNSKSLSIEDSLDEFIPQLTHSFSL